MNESLSHLPLDVRTGLFKSKVAAWSAGLSQSDDLVALGGLIVTYQTMKPGDEKEAFINGPFQAAYERLSQASDKDKKLDKALEQLFSAEETYF